MCNEKPHTRKLRIGLKPSILPVKIKRMQQARTRKSKEKILEALQRGWSLSGAARHARVSASQSYKWRREDKEFDEACDAAIEVGTDCLEDAAMNKAKRGKSDVLTMFLLNGRRPEKFRRKAEEAPAAVVEVRVRRFGDKK